jgi:hypothetical protein
MWCWIDGEKKIFFFFFFFFFFFLFRFPTQPGAGESGKSTVLKQVKNVYKIPFNKVELDSIKETIQFNCVQSMNILIKALVDYEIAVDSRTAKLVTQYTQCNTELTLPTAILIAKLWPRKPIQEAWAKRDDFWYLDAASYYFEHVERIGDPDFEPTEEDIVMARVRTTGISVTDFTQNGIDYSIVDVGGQRNERKKWIHCFPEHESQLLTSRGFLFLDDVLAHVDWRHSASHDGAIVVTDWRGLTVATYCERTARLVYRTPNALVVNDAGAQPLVEFSSAPQSTALSSPSLFGVSDDAARVSIVATSQHQLFALPSVDNRLDDGGGGGGEFRKLTCDDLLRGKAIADKTASLDDSERRAQLGAMDAVSFMAAAAAGVAMPSDAQSSARWLAAEFGLHDALEQTAFLEAYGRSLATAVDARVDQWALVRLDKRAVRCVLAGWQSVRPGPLVAASVELRDDLVRLLMHGGFSVTFALDFAHNDTIASSLRASWRVVFVEPDDVDVSVRLSGEAAQTARQLRGGRKAAKAAGRTWCFDMSSAPHLNDGFVVVRRVRRVTRAQFAELERHAPTLAPLVAAATADTADRQALKRLRAKASPIEKQVRAVSGQDDDWVVVSSSRPTIQGNCFDDVKAVLFVVSLIGYNQVMYEDAEQLRLREALTLFEQVVSNPAFVDSTFILALNKKDIFESMIREKPLSRTFPEFAAVEKRGLEGNELLQEALNFIQKQFEDAYFSKSSTPAARRAITTHIIAARFKKDVKYMVEDIHQFIGEHRPGAPRMSAAAATAAAKANAAHLTSGRAASTREAAASTADKPTKALSESGSSSHGGHESKSPRARDLSSRSRSSRSSPRSASSTSPRTEDANGDSPAPMSKRRSHKKSSSSRRLDTAAPAVAAATTAAATTTTSNNN